MGAASSVSTAGLSEETQKSLETLPDFAKKELEQLALKLSPTNDHDDTIKMLMQIVEDDEELPEWLEHASSPLTDGEKSLITQLYTLCDKFDGSMGDGIQIKKLMGIRVDLGPHEIKLYKELMKMDTSKDGIVSFDEMVAYFTVAHQFLSDKEFADMLADLIQSASKLNDLIKSLTQNALATGDDTAPEWAVEEEEPLSEEAQALVKALYGLCDEGDGDKDDGIVLKKLADVDISLGPHSYKLCKELELMDTSKDGVVSLPEMVSYFTMAGHFLSETDLKAVLGDLIEQAKKFSKSE